MNAVIHWFVHSLSTDVTVRNGLLSLPRNGAGAKTVIRMSVPPAVAGLQRWRGSSAGAARRVPAPARRRAGAALGGLSGTRRLLARSRTARRTSAGRWCDHRVCKTSDRRTLRRRNGIAASCSSWLVQFRFCCDPGCLARQLEVNLVLRGPEGREESRLPLTQEPVQVGAVLPGQFGSPCGAHGQPRSRHWVITPLWAGVRPQRRQAQARSARRR